MLCASRDAPKYLCANAKESGKQRKGGVAEALAQPPRAPAQAPQAEKVPGNLFHLSASRAGGACHTCMSEV